MADNNQLGGVNDDIIFVHTGGDQEVPGDVRRAKIDESIDTIPRSAFFECYQLIEVEGHNKLKKLEGWAFYRCRRLRWVSNMNGVIEIEKGAFHGCDALSDLDFDKLEIVGEGAFYYCKSLRSINLTYARRIGKFAFQNCAALTDAVFGEDLESIERSAFHNCPALIRIASFTSSLCSLLQCSILSTTDLIH